MAREDDDSRDNHQHMRALAARAATDSLSAAASRSCTAATSDSDRAARLRDCARGLEAEKAKMEVFRRELPISVRLVADVIDWLNDELARHRRRAPPDTFETAAEAPTPAKRNQQQQQPPKSEGGAVKAEAEADANDKRSWMSSAQLWTHDDTTAHTNGSVANRPPPPPHKQVSMSTTASFMPLAGLPTTFARSPGDAAGNKHAAMPFPDLSLSSPAVDSFCPAAAAAPSATSSAVTDAAGAQRQQQHQQQQQQLQRKARRCWSPELHRRFVAALQRLGGAQVATPKQIRELMKVDGLTNDEVKSHLQKYRLHTRRASSSDGGDHHHQAAGAGLWSSSSAAVAEDEQQQQCQYTTSQHSTSQSGSPQGPLQLTTVSSRAMSATAGDSCDGDEVEGGGRSESYGWERQHQHRTKASSS